MRAQILLFSGRENAVFRSQISLRGETDYDEMRLDHEAWYLIFKNQGGFESLFLAKMGLLPSFVPNYITPTV